MHRTTREDGGEIMDEIRLPTRDKPRMIDKHTMYFLGPRVQVIEFCGDVDVSQMRELWGLSGGYGSHTVAMVRDMKKLGKVGRQARKVLAQEGLQGLGEPNAELRVYIVNVNVLKRALVKMAHAAMRLATRQEVTLIMSASLDEALAMAQQYAQDYDREHGPVRASAR